jgi:hypothetical protein
MKIVDSPEYARAGYYDFYGRPAVVWISTFGDLQSSIYDPDVRTFLDYNEPRRIFLDGHRIDRVKMAGLIRATTKARTPNKVCDVCGQNETWGVHNECGDAVLSRLDDDPDPEGTTYRFRNVIQTAIQTQLGKELKGTPPSGLRLVTILYYWAMAFPVVGVWAPLKWEVLSWALKGRVNETVRYLEMLGTPRAGKVLASLIAHRDYRFPHPNCFASAWGQGIIQNNFAWLKKEWDQKNSFTE